MRTYLMGGSRSEFPLPSRVRSCHLVREEKSIPEFLENGPTYFCFVLTFRNKIAMESVEVIGYLQISTKRKMILTKNLNERS